MTTVRAGSLRGRLGRAGRRVAWYVHSVMGDNAYARYVAHQRAQHPGEPVPSEKEFWKARHADAEANPKARCC